MSIPEIPVKVTVKTTIHQSGSKETIELVVFGRYYKKEQASFLQYVEETEEGSIRTIVKMAADEALILRSGAIKMRMPFRLHKKMFGSYEMPFGRFETTATAKSIELGQGFFNILYDFSMQGNPAGTYHLEITFQEEIK